MTNTLYVCNLPFVATPDDIKTHFSTIGEVTKIHISLDRQTGRPRGFGFVSYSTSEQAAQAIQKLNGSILMGRALRVTQARPLEQRPRHHQHHQTDKSPPLEKPPQPGHQHLSQQQITPDDLHSLPGSEPQHHHTHHKKKFKKHKFQRPLRDNHDFERAKSRRHILRQYQDDDQDY